MGKRRKKIPKEEFDKIQNKDWKPFILENDDIPSIFKGIPEEKLCMVTISSSSFTPNPEADGNKTLLHQVGGIDVYRYAEEQDDTELKKDWYRIFEDTTNPDQYFLVGPIKDKEHWLDDLSERLREAIVYKKEEEEYFGGEDEVLDWYKKLRKKITLQLSEKRKFDSKLDSSFAKIADVLIWLPDFFHLGIKLLFDKSIPANNKGALIAAIDYVISPIDLIPDNIPVAGWVDDLIVMTIGLHSFINAEDDIIQIVNKHWAGDGDVLDKIRHVLEIADEAAPFLPRRLMLIIKSMFPEAGGIK